VLGERSGIEVDCRSLRRRRNTPHQTRVKDRAQRAASVRGAFGCDAELKGRRVLLVGKEGMGYAGQVRVPADIVLCQSLSLMGQDRSLAPRLGDVLRDVGMKPGQRVGVVGLGERRVLGQQRAVFGEEVARTPEIVNDKTLPLAWLEIEDTVPGGALTLEPAHVSPSHIPNRRLLTMLLSVRWYERVRRHYTVTCAARGVHAFGPATLRTGDVFGLTTKEMEVPQEDYLLVYPKIVPFERLSLPASNPFGDVTLRRQWLFEDPLRTVGIRDYRPGDSPRRMHWKATARAPGQALQCLGTPSAAC